ncbi:MAG TPA: cellulose synthase, partial [Polyangiaceae bacterium]|nr:cellulose synthase [Polyangiaceae bacterium]
ETTLVSVLSTEPSNKVALERLYGVATKTGDKALARSSLERLAESETDLAQRTEYLLRVAEACREANDGNGMLRALSDAVVSTPADIRPWTLLSRCYRSDTQEGAAGLARSIEQIIEMAKARRRPIEARWLFTLGLLEVNMLKRVTDGIAHLQTAVSVAAAPGSPPGTVGEVRAGLGAGLLAAGRNKEAVQILRDLVSTDAETLLRLAEPASFITVRNAAVAPTGPVLAAVLACLDAALSTEGRAEECVPVEEVRALMGDLGGERVAKLRARRLDPDVPFANGYIGSELSKALVPEARTPVVDLAVAIQPIAAKALRFELATLGISSRDRIGPRDGHPTRHLADRIARCLGIQEYELYLTQSWSGAIRVYPGDPPALVGPVGLVDLPEGEQLFALGRLMTRIALGMTWLDEISVDVADALLLASMRSVLPQFGLGEVSQAREHSVGQLLPSVQRAIGRKQRRALEELAPTLPATFDFRSLSIALRRSEYRLGYVLSGDLLGCLEYLKRFDADIGRAAESSRIYLQHPVTSELIRYALGPDSYQERRRVGTLWTGTRQTMA